MKFIAPVLALMGVAYAESSCTWTTYAAFNAYNVYIDQNCFTDAQGYCSGYLDNLRGQCGPITNWQASEDDGGSRFYFNTDQFHTNKCVQDAIYLASNPHIEGLTCNSVKGRRRS